MKLSHSFAQTFIFIHLQTNAYVMKTTHVFFNMLIFFSHFFTLQKVLPYSK